MNRNQVVNRTENQPAGKPWRDWLRSLVVAVAAILLAASGLRWCSALGDDATAKGAKKTDAKSEKIGQGHKDDAKTDKAGDKKDAVPPAQPDKAELKDPNQEAMIAAIDLMQEMLKAMKNPGGPTPDDLDHLMQMALQKAMQMQNLPAQPGVPQNQFPPQGAVPGGGQGFPALPALPGFPQNQFPQQGGFPGGLKPLGGFGPGGKGFGGGMKFPGKFGGQPGNGQFNIKQNANVQKDFNVTRLENNAVINVQGTTQNGAVTLKGITINDNGTRPWIRFPKSTGRPSMA